MTHFLSLLIQSCDRGHTDMWFLISFRKVSSKFIFFKILPVNPVFNSVATVMLFHTALG